MVGAVSVMDWQARRRATPGDVRAALYELYLRRHDRIDNWDLVDRSAPYVVGGYLFDKPREPLYQLARSSSQWERRTAIVATYFFIRQGEVDDTFRIAEILVDDEADLVQKAVGGWVREAANATAIACSASWTCTPPRCPAPRCATRSSTCRRRPDSTTCGCGCRPVQAGNPDEITSLPAGGGWVSGHGVGFPCVSRRMAW